ncbi:MAG: GntR family transcriptional regulator [Desulfobacterales bacterium]|jgi:GntR family transcriptional regulator|nr:GntR family transcriptional regulator [Desulfobacterales bacterium]
MEQTGVPMYFKVAATLKRRILSRAYPPGGWIPAAKDLAREFSVSTITIRKAVELLTREGYLAARQGAGTRVKLPELKKMEIQISGDFRAWHDSASGLSPRLEVEVLDLAPFQPPERIRTILGIARDEPLGRLRRLRRHQGQIVSYFINYFGLEHLKRLPRGKLTRHSFIEVFQGSTQVRFKCLEQRVEAVIAEMDLAEVLDTGYGAPLFFVENIYYSHHDRPLVVTHMYYRGDRYVYRASIPLNAEEPALRRACVAKKADAA